MKYLELEERERVLFCTLNRPKQYNALSQDLIDELTEFFNSLYSQHKAARVVIIKGSGRGFSAGHDLKEILLNPSKKTYEQLVGTCSDLMSTIRSLPIPVIAQVHGVATAAGCQLAASCDLAYASETAQFATPGVLIGLFCSTPMVALSRSVPQKPALEMLLSGQMINAQRAKDLGLINEYFPDAELDKEVFQIAQTIAERSQTAIQFGKSLFYQQLELSEPEAYKKVGSIMVQNLLHQDAQEGINAFLEKRKPKWE